MRARYRDGAFAIPVWSIRLDPDFASLVSGFPSTQWRLCSWRVSYDVRALPRIGGKAVAAAGSRSGFTTSAFRARFRLTTRQAALLRCTAEHVQAHATGARTPSRILLRHALRAITGDMLAPIRIHRPAIERSSLSG